MFFAETQRAHPHPCMRIFVMHCGYFYVPAHHASSSHSGPDATSFSSLLKLCRIAVTRGSSMVTLAVMNWLTSSVTWLVGLGVANVWMVEEGDLLAGLTVSGSRSALSLTACVWLVGSFPLRTWLLELAAFAGRDAGRRSGSCHTLSNQLWNTEWRKQTRINGFASGVAVIQQRTQFLELFQDLSISDIMFLVSVYSCSGLFGLPYAMAGGLSQECMCKMDTPTNN